MKLPIGVLALVFAAGLAPAVLAQEAEKKEEPPKEAAAPPADAAPAPEEKPAPAAVPPKELSPSAQALVPLADSYKKAYDDMQAWIAQVDTKTSGATEGVKKIESQIQANGDAMTKAKLAGDNATVKELTKQSKALMTELETARNTAAAAAGPVVKEATDRVKRYGAASDQALADLKAKAK